MCAVGLTTPLRHPANCITPMADTYARTEIIHRRGVYLGTPFVLRTRFPTVAGNPALSFV